MSKKTNIIALKEFIQEMKYERTFYINSLLKIFKENNLPIEDEFVVEHIELNTSEIECNGYFRIEMTCEYLNRRLHLLKNVNKHYLKTLLDSTYQYAHIDRVFMALDVLEDNIHFLKNIRYEQAIKR